MARKFTQSQLNQPAKLIHLKPLPPHQQDQCFSLYKKGVEKGTTIHFIKDPATTAIVADPREVSYDGKIAPIYPHPPDQHPKRGEVNNSGTYRGADHWMYGRVKLTKLVDKIESQWRTLVILGVDLCWIKLNPTHRALN